MQTHCIFSSTAGTTQHTAQHANRFDAGTEHKTSVHASKSAVHSHSCVYNYKPGLSASTADVAGCICQAVTTQHYSFLQNIILKATASSGSHHMHAWPALAVQNAP
jgi:hypothetical protein